MSATHLLLSVIAACMMAAAAAPVRLAEAGPLELGAAPTRIALAAPAGVFAAAAGRRARLVLSGLSAQAQPGVVYRVSLNDPASSVGYINFYNVVTGGPSSFSFDAEKALIYAAEHGRITVILSPMGSAKPDARATIGKIAFLAY